MIAPTIIGLTGPAGCGKDTVAMLLATHARFAMLAFAEPLRYEICDAFNLDYAQLTTRETKEVPTPALSLERCRNGAFVHAITMHHVKAGKPWDTLTELAVPRSPRQIMRWWGTEFRRDTVGNDYWTRKLINRIHIQQKTGQWRHVVSDVRFANEAWAIRRMGGQVWQIKRPELKLDISHSSETTGSAFAPDVVINNCYDLRHLQMMVVGAWIMQDNGLHARDLVDMGSTFAEGATA